MFVTYCRLHHITIHTCTILTIHGSEKANKQSNKHGREEAKATNKIEFKVEPPCKYNQQQRTDDEILVGLYTGFTTGKGTMGSCEIESWWTHMSFRHLKMDQIDELRNSLEKLGSFPFVKSMAVSRDQKDSWETIFPKIYTNHHFRETRNTTTNQISYNVTDRGNSLIKNDSSTRKYDYVL